MALGGEIYYRQQAREQRDAAKAADEKLRAELAARETVAVEVDASDETAQNASDTPPVVDDGVPADENSLEENESAADVETEDSPTGDTPEDSDPESEFESKDADDDLL